MHAWIVVILCFLCLIAGLVALIFLDDGVEERAAADRAHQTQAHLHTFRPRLDADPRSLAAAARVQRVSEDVERVAPRVGSRQAKGWNKR